MFHAGSAQHTDDESQHQIGGKRSDERSSILVSGVHDAKMTELQAISAICDMDGYRRFGHLVRSNDEMLRTKAEFRNGESVT
jgi:hypothetical protein